jgi:hypothetical protein
MIKRATLNTKAVKIVPPNNWITIDKVFIVFKFNLCLFDLISRIKIQSILIQNANK